MGSGLDESLLASLACPRDHLALRESGPKLVCANGHEYAVIQGVPVMLLEDVPETLAVIGASLREASKRDDLRDPYFIDSVGCSPEERAEIRKLLASPVPGEVDPVVQYVLAATNGILYRGLLGKLRDYPIPEIRLPESSGETLLDVGCNWGRWCMAAARKGYRTTGIDPSLGSILAAKRTAAQLNLKIHFVVGDARFLPFASSSFARVFSYSVLQHFSRENVATALQEVERVLQPGGASLIQMANGLGVRSLQHQLRRGFRDPENFDVRYWMPREVKRTFSKIIGPTTLSVDGYFGLGIQAADMKVMPARFRAVIKASEILRGISRSIPAITSLADSIYAHSRKAG